eukprot:scaffold697_cov142-Alexandrium_tamarense.AAC.14
MANSQRSPFKAISRINPDLAAKLEHLHGGADCPNLWLSSNNISNNNVKEQTSPFLMMRHHKHSFRHNDPVRLLEHTVIPEGFRAMLTEHSLL